MKWKSRNNMTLLYQLWLFLYWTTTLTITVSANFLPGKICLKCAFCDKKNRVEDRGPRSKKRSAFLLVKTQDDEQIEIQSKQFFKSLFLSFEYDPVNPDLFNEILCWTNFCLVKVHCFQSFEVLFLSFLLNFEIPNTVMSQLCIWQWRVVRQTESPK